MQGKTATSRVALVLAMTMVLLLSAAGLVMAMGDTKKMMPAQEQMAAYKLYKQKCVVCHDSIADPERPGKTRDGWTIVVKYMGDHFVDLNDQEAYQIINLLYAIRRGLEREPG